MPNSLMRFRGFILSVGLLAVFTAPALSAGGPGSTAAAGLKVYPGARPGGMGGAFIGLADDMNSIFWNPAGLAHIDAPEASIFYAPYLVGSSLQMVEYAQPIPLLGTIAASLTLLDYGSDDRTTERPDGLFGDRVGLANPQDIFAIVGWGRDIPPLLGMSHLKAGVSAKMTFQNVAGRTIPGFGTSVGILWDTPVEKLRLGMVADNLGYAAAEGAKTLPIAWAVGASYGAKMGRNVDVVYVFDTKLSVDTTAGMGVGAEALAFNILYVRGGWRGGGAEGGATWGLGVFQPINYSGRQILLRLDYNSMSYGELGISHRVQLSLRMGGAPVTNLGSVRLERSGGEPVLTWKGKSPAFRILYRRSDWDEFRQLTDAPVEDTRYPLTGLEPGEYSFKIIEADPYDPDKEGAESGEIRLKLESGPEAKPVGGTRLPSRDISGTVMEEPEFEPAPAAIPQGLVPEAVPQMPQSPEAPVINPGEAAPLPMEPSSPGGR